MRSLTLFFATGAGTGYSPVAPGTAGSIPGLLLAWLLFAPLWRYSPAVFILVFAALFGAACRIADRAEQIFGNRDDSRIVIDEVLGMVAAMFLLPTDWRHMALGFGLFRLFDIIKPFPADLIDRRMRGGAAVMLDDLVSAIYANLVGQALSRFIY
ncbi:MAG: phosphatidylglycerophosphatase A [Candidatus Binataceae bacterium]